jgi:hypothetical protein
MMATAAPIANPSASVPMLRPPIATTTRLASAKAPIIALAAPRLI